MRSPAKRVYVMRARAAATAATRQAILDAAYERFVRERYDDVTLQQIAADAGVTVPTVLRHFQSKAGLIAAGAELWRSDEWDRRAVPPGDVVGAARVLAARYEIIYSATCQLRSLAAAVPAVERRIEEARRGHHAWLAGVFAPHLPATGTVRARRLALLFAATEIEAWAAWRTTFGLSLKEATRCLTEHLRMLVDAWSRDDGGGRR